MNVCVYFYMYACICVYYYTEIDIYKCLFMHALEYTKMHVYMHIFT